MSFNIKKKKVYIVTIILKDKDEEGNDINWSTFREEYYADTYDIALAMKKRFLNGEDEYYGNLIEDCYISDEKEEREFYI